MGYYLLTMLGKCHFNWSCFDPAAFDKEHAERQRDVDLPVEQAVRKNSWGQTRVCQVEGCKVKGSHCKVERFTKYKVHVVKWKVHVVKWNVHVVKWNVHVVK